MHRNMDMLHGSLADKILLFTFPFAATGILQQLFNAADVAVVGRYVGPNAMAAVGSNASLVGLCVTLFIGISMGSNVVISHGVGQNDPEKISRAVHTSILMSLIGGVSVAILGQFFIPRILGLLSVPEEILPMSTLYLRIYMCGLPTIFLYNFESSIFRSQGDTRSPLIVLTISGVLNVVLNLFFVVVVGMTVDGVALATIISNAASAIALLIKLMRSDSAVRVDLRKLRIHGRELRQILRIGIPAGIQGMMFSLANILIQSGINSLGAVVMAASSAAFNVECIAYYVISAFGQACTTFAGQNYGAGDMDRCKAVLKRCVQMGVVTTIILCLGFLAVGKQLLGLFTTDGQVVEIAYTRLIFIYSAYVFSELTEVMSGYLRAFNWSMIPTAASLIGVCGVRVLWIYTAFPRFHTFAGLLVIYPISMFVTASVLWMIYFLNRKRLYRLEPIQQV